MLWVGILGSPAEVLWSPLLWSPDVWVVLDLLDLIGIEGDHILSRGPSILPKPPRGCLFILLLCYGECCLGSAFYTSLKTSFFKVLPHDQSLFVKHSPPCSQTLCHLSNSITNLWECMMVVSWTSMCDGTTWMAQDLGTCWRQASQNPCSGPSGIASYTPYLASAA